MDFYPLLRFAHIVSAFVFIGGHGVSMFVAFRLRSERDPARMLALLDLSAFSLNVAGVGMLLVLGTGIAAGIVGGWFGMGWIWLSIALFVVVGGLMTPVAGAHFTRLRHGLGQRTRNMKASQPDPIPLPLDELNAMARGRAPEITAVIGLGGLVTLLWLMTFRPF